MPETNPSTVTTDVDFDIDEFLNMPNADSVIVGTDEKSKTPAKPSFFSAPTSGLEFLDEEQAAADKEADEKLTPEEREAKERARLTVDEAFADLDPKADEEEEGAEGAGAAEKKTGRPRTDKSALVSTVNKLIEEGHLVAFDDDKPLEEYTEKEFQELITTNLKAQREELEEKTRQEFLESLPDELVAAAKYAASGGTDMKGMFRALSQVESVKSLDVKEPKDQEEIVRQYLQATNFGEDADIEDQIDLYKSSGVLGKWAEKHKPKLDAMHEELVQNALEKQEKQKLELIQQRKDFQDNVYEALNKGELGGTKLERKRQQYLWEETTQTKYTTSTGRPTNLLGKLLEDYQKGDTKRYDLILEATWLLSDPEDYRAKMSAKSVNKEVIETARKLKNEESRKTSTTTGGAGEEDPENTSRQPKKLQRPNNGRNFFART